MAGHLPGRDGTEQPLRSLRSAARGARCGIAAAYDVVWFYYHHEEGFLAEVQLAKGLILTVVRPANPRQTELLHQGLSPPPTIMCCWSMRTR